MGQIIEILSDILTQLDARQNQYIKKYDERSDDYMECIHIVKHALLKEVDKDVFNSSFNSPFNALIDRRIHLSKETLQKKNKEYASENDPFHNFKAAGRRRDQTPEQALVGMMAKHEVSVDDLVEWAGISPERITKKLIDEKIGDNINYLILLEGLLKERIGG